MRRGIIAGIIAGLAVSNTGGPAHAFFGTGGVVIDPTNLVQNILTATHTLEQINNQINQLQNEANMILNQIEDLKRLDISRLSDLRRILEQIDALMREADDITYEVATSEERYRETYPESYLGLSNTEIVQRATDHWQISRRAFGHSIKVQSGIVTSINDARSTLNDLVTASNQATGNLAVSQAGNELAALSIEQQMQMQQLMAAHYRMIATDAARRNAIEEQARIRHTRFRGDGVAYTRN